MALPPKVLEKLETLPDHPGVYLFRGFAETEAPAGPTEAFPPARGEVLYIGKARSLRSRVRSYFQPGTSDVRLFVRRLDRELADIETFVAGSEKEAALLENQLIKQHKPRYNIKLRDDKEYLSLRLAPKTQWPRLEVVRRPKPDGAHYFGPYHAASSARQTLRLVNRHFQLRTCTNSELRSRHRACLQYQIRRCLAPCVLDVDQERYAEQVKDVALFLGGRHDELVDALKSRMAEAAASMEYEQAALHRDQLRAVERVQQSQRVTSVSRLDQDVIGFFRQADLVEVAVLQLRAGRLVSIQTFDLKGVALPDDELIASFAAEWYLRAPVPDEILLPVVVEAMQGLQALLAERRARAGSRTKKLSVRAPQRGKGKKLVDLAHENAEHAFTQKRRSEEDVGARLLEVQNRLRLPVLPHRIECLDISHTGGDDTVAAVVALLDGKPDRKRYRTYHVKRVRGGDDYGAMYEVMLRRFKRGRDGDKGWELPDLFVVDGGKGQLNMALAALSDLDMTLPVVGLAKEKENPLGDKRVDRIYLPGQKNAIPVHSAAALQMLCLARDEAHRSSNRIRIKLGKKRRFTSDLDSVKGVGPKTRAKLLTVLGSLAAVRAASVDELVRAGASKRQAAAIHQTLSSGEMAAPDDDGVAIENAFDLLR